MEHFDPYRKWLGISATDKPPNHYRLLGLVLFESDLDVIDGAAERQISSIRHHLGGQHADEAARVLEELAEARRCLLLPAAKADYDAVLKSQAATINPASSTSLPELPEPRVKRRTSTKVSASPATRRLPIPQKAIIGGACAVLVMSIGIGMVLIRPRSESAQSSKGSATTSDEKASETESSSRDIAKVSSIPVPLEPAAEAKPVGEAIDLLKLVNLENDIAWGGWKFADGSLVGDRLSRIYLPIKPPEDYQARYSIRRLNNSDAIVFGFMMGGRQGLLNLDGWFSRFSGLYVDGREPTDNCTTRTGQLLQDQKNAEVVLTVHPNHVHATCNGKTIVDWRGTPDRLLLNQDGLASRECLSVSLFQSSFAIDSAQLIPIQPEPAAVTPKQVDRPIDLMPLVDLERDGHRGVWALNKGTLHSPEGAGRLYLPGRVPETYTLSLNVELPAEHVGGYVFCLGLATTQSYFQFVCTQGGTGLDLLDGRLRWDQNETHLAEGILKPGAPTQIDCTVTADGVRIESQGKLLVNWRGDVRRWSIPGDWALPDARRCFLASSNHFKVRQIKLSPPAETKSQSIAPSSSQQKVDLLARIDSDRDAMSGIWNREGSSLRVQGQTLRSKLVVPYDPPPEYQLNFSVAREPGGLSNNQAFFITVPIGSTKALIVIDGWDGGISGITLDGADLPIPLTPHRGALLSEDSAQEFVCLVKRNSVELKCRDRTLFEWSGNLDRLCIPATLQTPGGRIALMSWNSRFRVDKLELQSLPPSAPKPPLKLISEGHLTPLLEAQRDSRRGQWVANATELTCPAIPGARLEIPLDLPRNYEFSATVERVQGNEDVYFGLVVGGRPTIVTVDGDRGTAAGLDNLDGLRFNHAMNLTGRKYSTPRFPAQKPVSVRCTVLTDTIIVRCGEDELIRWHGDPRRLSECADLIPLNYSVNDRQHLWIGAWASICKFRDLEIRTLSDAEANQLVSTFSGVFPKTAQRDIPLKAVDIAKVTPVSPAAVPANPARAPVARALDVRDPVPEGSGLAAMSLWVEKKYSTAPNALAPKKEDAIEGLLSLASRRDTDPVRRYAALERAMGLATEIGEFSLFDLALDRLIEAFRVSEFQERPRRLADYLQKCRIPAGMQRAMDGSIAAAIDASSVQNSDEALKLLEAAEAASRRHKELASKFKVRLTTIQQAIIARDAFQKSYVNARAMLNVNALDNSANLIVGQWLALFEQDWKASLAYFEKAGDSRWKSVVDLEIKLPQEAGERLVLADAWWNLSQANSGDLKLFLTFRAGRWYELAAPQLPEPGRKRAFSRFKEVEPAQDDIARLLSKAPGQYRWIDLMSWVQGVDWLPLGYDWNSALDSPPSRKGIKFKAGGSFPFPAIIEGSYELDCEFTHHGPDCIAISIPIGIHNVAVGFYGNKGKIDGLACIEGKGLGENLTAHEPSRVKRGNRHRVHIAVQRHAGFAHIDVTLDNDRQNYLSWKGLESALTYTTEPPIASNTQHVWAHANGGASEFHSMQIRMTSGTIRRDTITDLDRDHDLKKGFVRLVGETPMSATAGWGKVWINQCPMTGAGLFERLWPLTTQELVECDDYYGAHAPSRIETSIPAGAKSFSVIGYNHTSRTTSYKITADGVKKLYESGATDIAIIKVNIPANTSQLELIIDPVGDIGYDHSFWCYPRFHRVPAEEIKDEMLDSKNDVLPWDVKHSRVQGGPLTHNERIFPSAPLNFRHASPCDEFIFAHAVSSIKYAVPAGMNRFTAIGYCCASEAVRYEVWVNSRKIYESPRAGIVPIDVKLPPEAKYIELRIESFGNGFMDWSMWCYPRLYQDAK